MLKFSVQLLWCCWFALHMKRIKYLHRFSYLYGQCMLLNCPDSLRFILQTNYSFTYNNFFITFHCITAHTFLCAGCTLLLKYARMILNAVVVDMTNCVHIKYVFGDSMHRLPQNIWAFCCRFIAIRTFSVDCGWQNDYAIIRNESSARWKATSRYGNRSIQKVHGSKCITFIYWTITSQLVAYNVANS